MTIFAPDWSPAERGLYLMNKPPTHLRAQVAALPRTVSHRNPDLLHTTLLAFPDLAECPDGFLPTLQRVMDMLRADATYAYYDRIQERRAVSPRSSKGQRGMRTLQKQVARHLLQCGFTFFVLPGNIHMTIRYGKDGMGDEPIDPITWLVDEVLLIESMGGKSIHLVHGRWQLNPLLI